VLGDPNWQEEMDFLSRYTPHRHIALVFDRIIMKCLLASVCAFACFAQSATAGDKSSAPKPDSPIHRPTQSPSELALLAGKQLAKIGVPGVPACFSCHGAEGIGNGPHFPAISGVPAAVTIERLHLFQARARERGPKPGTMRAVASALNKQQIEEVSAYLAQKNR
jgi:cytochrome c553